MVTVLCLATACRGTATTSSSAPRVAPSPSGVADRVSITFPDGGHAELVLPQIDGVEWGQPQPDVTLLWEGEYRAGPVAFSREGRLERLLAGKEPVKVLGEGRSVWRGRGNLPGRADRVFEWLVVELSPLTVHIPVPDGVAAKTLSAVVHPRRSSDGLVVMETSPPASLAQVHGEGGGPEVTIGDASPLPGVVDPGEKFQFIELAPDRCTPEPQPIETDIGGPDDAYAGLCLAEGRFFASVYGDRAFVARVAADLRVLRFTPA